VEIAKVYILGHYKASVLLVLSDKSRGYNGATSMD